MPTKKKAKRVQKISPGDYTQRAIKEYGTYVNEDRATADSRDGLKPVQRRILFSAWKIGTKPTKPHVKCARIVGDTVGKYHPHGDSAVYGTLVNMVHAQHALMDGHGNFGSLTKPEFAAMRYTEARLSKIGMAMFDDSSVMEMMENYDGKDMEPVVLPARVPVLLMNGSEGIGVGVSANVPPNNLRELFAATELLMEDPESEEIYDVLHGPDFGYGHLISSRSEIRRVYEEGQGSLRFRCKYHYEIRDGKNELVITEFAPRFNYRSFVEKCKPLMEEGVIDHVSNNTSHKTGLRICVGFRSPKLLKERFLKLLRVSGSWHFNALSNRSFKRYSVRGLLLDFIEFRRDIEEKVLRHQLEQARSKLLKEKAKLAASKNLRALMDALEKNLPEEKLIKAIVKALELDSDEQAKYLLSCPIRTLARVNREKTVESIKELRSQIKAIKTDLKDIDAVVLRRFKEIVDKFGKERGTTHSKKEPLVAESVGSIFVGMTEGGGFNKFTTFPRTNKQDFDYMVITDDLVTAVCQNGKARVVEVQTQKRGGLKIGKSPIVGAVPSTRRYMIVLDELGKGIVIDQKRLNLKKGELDFNTMKTEANILGAWGADADDQIVVWNDSFFEVMTGSSLKTRRKNSLGYRLLKGRKPYDLIVVPRGCYVITDEGERIKDYEELHTRDLYARDLFVIAKKANIVMIEDKKFQLSGMEIEMKYERGDAVDLVFPMV